MQGHINRAQRNEPRVGGKSQRRWFAVWRCFLSFSACVCIIISHHHRFIPFSHFTVGPAPTIASINRDWRLGYISNESLLIEPPTTRSVGLRRRDSRFCVGVKAVNESFVVAVSAFDPVVVPLACADSCKQIGIVVFKCSQIIWIWPFERAEKRGCIG